METEELRAQVAREVGEAVAYLAEQGRLAAGSLVVLGCSTSEVCGGRIGKKSDPEMGKVLAEAFLRACEAHGLAGCVQCCEHLNRALVIERRQAEIRGLEEVMAVPYPKAGGSCGAAYYRMLRDPILVEAVSADAGMDIGDTLIGMHLRRVAIPVRLSIKKIGEANILCARTRPKYIGGARAVYQDL